MKNKRVILSRIAMVLSIAAAQPCVADETPPASALQLQAEPLEVSNFALDPTYLFRLPGREFSLGSFTIGRRFTAGIGFREERELPAIPDLGAGNLALTGGFDAGAVAQDIQASSNRLLAQAPRKNPLRMNFLKLDNQDYRVDFTQHPSRTGLRFHHLASGLRIEAERRLIGTSSNIFVGVRLLEDRRFDPTLGCSVQNGKNALESHNFCGFRLRVGL